jgi:hypothetical protein
MGEIFQASYNQPCHKFSSIHLNSIGIYYREGLTAQMSVTMPAQREK